MSCFSHYSTNQIVLQFSSRNQDLVQAPHQGTSEIGTGEESEIPPPPSYHQLPNHPMRSPNRPHISCHLTIIGSQVPTNMKTGSQHLPQVTSGHSKHHKINLSGACIFQVKSFHSICQLMAPTAGSAT
ncbi:hypothetical protein O181_011391 [Austropuccinia psidii MF-1]|uniref:Uncharacterized protein n=1 Tax=Austropuccinia psidii MF-1 TaxID=1389203 RepID=A0A9Q3BSR1_9BASI|nr:hypothetical protein [Austropuccinia psidii MF-1]